MVKTEIQCTIKDTLLMPSNYISLFNNTVILMTRDKTDKT